MLVAVHEDAVENGNVTLATSFAGRFSTPSSGSMAAQPAGIPELAYWPENEVRTCWKLSRQLRTASSATALCPGEIADGLTVNEAISTPARQPVPPRSFADGAASAAGALRVRVADRHAAAAAAES